MAQTTTTVAPVTTLQASDKDRNSGKWGLLGLLGLPGLLGLMGLKRRDREDPYTRRDAPGATAAR
jgi:hypothetical protein